MNKYQKEIEKLLQTSETVLSDELQEVYRELANEINQEVIQLAKEIEETNKFPKKLQQERLSTIRDQMYRKADSLADDQKGSIYNFLRFNGETAYNELFYEFEMSEKIPLAFSMLSEKQINVIINTPVASRKLSTRLQGNARKIKQNLNSVLTRGFAKGLSSQKMAQQISEIGQATYKRSLNIARTEAGRVSGITRQQAQSHAQEIGIKLKKKWVSTLDLVTRPSHARLDGQVKEIDEYFKIDGHEALQPHMFGIAAEDCNCRCRSISELEGYESDLRRDNETGEEIDYKNYQEWLREKQGSAETWYDPSKPQTPEKLMDGVHLGKPMSIKEADGHNANPNYLGRTEEERKKIKDYQDKIKAMKSDHESMKMTIKERVKKASTQEEKTKLINSSQASLDKIKALEKEFRQFKAKTIEPYTVNCQRCVPAYELRRRGYNVTALPNTPNMSRFEKYRIPAEMFRDKDGVIQKGSILKAKSNSRVTEELYKSMTVGERGTLDWGWGKTNDGHIINVERTEEGLLFIDAQTGKVSKTFEDYMGDQSFTKTFKGIKTGVNYNRVDDKFLDLENIGLIVEKG